MGFSACWMSPGVVTAVDFARFVRHRRAKRRRSSNGYAPGHPLGPFARVAGVCSSNTSGPYPWRRRTGIVANHRIPLRDRKTVRTRPHIGAGRRDNNQKLVFVKDKFTSNLIVQAKKE